MNFQWKIFYWLFYGKKERRFYVCIVTWCPGGLREGRYLGELRSWWITCKREGAEWALAGFTLCRSRLWLWPPTWPHERWRSRMGSRKAAFTPSLATPIPPSQTTSAKNEAKMLRNQTGLPYAPWEIKTFRPVYVFAAFTFFIVLSQNVWSKYCHVSYCPALWVFTPLTNVETEI